MKYVGLADCNGLECFIHVDLNNAIAKLGGKSYINPTEILAVRARANNQRHAVVYRAEVKSETANKIKKLIDEGKCELALIILKEEGEEIELARTGINAEKAWKMIPNKDLDPFS